MLNTNESVAFLQSLVFSFFAFWLIRTVIVYVVTSTVSQDSMFRASNWNEMTLKGVIVAIIAVSGIGAYFIYKNGLHEWYGFMACFISLGYVLVNPLIQRLKKI